MSADNLFILFCSLHTKKLATNFVILEFTQDLLHNLHSVQAPHIGTIDHEVLKSKSMNRYKMQENVIFLNFGKQEAISLFTEYYCKKKTHELHLIQYYIRFILSSQVFSLPSSDIICDLS